MTMRNVSGWALATVLAVAAQGCTVNLEKNNCTPDKVYDCQGADGCAGKQRCRTDGLAFYDACLCGSGGPICTVGQSIDCRGTSQCVGHQECAVDGLSWGSCICNAGDVIEDVIDTGDVPSPDAIDVVGTDLPLEAGDLGPDLPPWQEPAARVLYDLFVTPIDGFFPWDRHLGSDGTILVDGDAHSNSNLPLLDNGPYPASLKQVHGFASFSPLVFQVSVPIDPASLPGDLAASTAADASIRVYALDEAGALADRAPFKAQFLDFTADGYWMIRLDPAFPLAAKRYLLVATDGLKDKDGNALARSRGFAQVLGQAALPAGADPARVAQVQAEGDRIGPLMAALPDADHVLAAATFTTGFAYDDALDLKAVMSRFIPPSVPPEIPFNLDLDNDGNPDVVLDGNLDDCPMDPAVMGWAIKGTFGPWNLTDPDDGHWVREGDGFKTFDPQKVDFHLMVPVGEGPFPIVLAQHGIAADQGAMCQAARLLVTAGMAVLRFDFPRHGSRGNGTNATGWGADFLGIDDPIRVRENFRQAALDIASAIALLDELAPLQDGWPKGAPDGKTELDTAHIAYLGHSLGSIIGLLYLPFSARVEAFLSNVGGLGMFYLVEIYIQKAFGAVFLAQGYQSASEHAVWTGDGIAYADRMLTGYFREPGKPARLLDQMVMNDDTVANPSNETLARAVGLPQVGPVHNAIPGILYKDAATVESGIMQFDGVKHGSFVGGDQPNADLERRQAIHYLQSWFTTGKAEIITE